MKNICMISQSAYPQDPRVRREAEALADKGYHVDIICLKLNGQKDKEKFRNITAYRIVKRSNKEKLRNYLLLSAKFFVMGLFTTFKLLMNKKYVLAQAHNMPDYIVFTLVLFKLKKIPVVLDVHDLTYDLAKEKWVNKKESFFKFIDFIERKSYCFADQIITVSTMFKESIANKGIDKNKIEIILNTPNPKIFKYNTNRSYKSKGSVRLIYHGTVANRIGIHILIAAIALVKPYLENIQLEIYSMHDEAYFSFLQELISKYDLQDNIYFNNIIPQEEIVNKIAEADIGVVPYLNTNFMNSLYPTKLFEYAACGIPIITSNLSSLKNIFRNDSLICYDNDDPYELASKIIAVVDEYQVTENMVISAYEDIQKVSGEKMAQKYYLLISKLTSNELINNSELVKV